MDLLRETRWLPPLFDRLGQVLRWEHLIIINIHTCVHVDNYQNDGYYKEIIILFLLKLNCCQFTVYGKTCIHLAVDEYIPA